MPRQASITTSGGTTRRRCGRFLSKDPISADIGRDPIAFDAGDYNLYRYVDDTPTGGLDPSGLIAESEQKMFRDSRADLLDQWNRRNNCPPPPPLGPSRPHHPPRPCCPSTMTDACYLATLALGAATAAVALQCNTARPNPRGCALAVAAAIIAEENVRLKCTLDMFCPPDTGFLEDTFGPGKAHIGSFY